jgi:hypothetical protein
LLGSSQNPNNEGTRLLPSAFFLPARGGNSHGEPCTLPGSQDFLKETLLMILEQVVDRLERLETMLKMLVERPRTKEYYTTIEAGKVLDRDPFTVREWCRHGRIHAQKRKTGRGKSCEWMISHDELVRIENHGLLPIQKRF